MCEAAYDVEPGGRPGLLEEEVERERRITHAWAVARNLRDGRTLCRKCEQPMDGADGPPIHPGWCWTCEQTWIEERILAPLVERIGSRGTRRALIRLVDDVKSLT